MKKLKKIIALILVSVSVSIYPEFFNMQKGISPSSLALHNLNITDVKTANYVKNGDLSYNSEDGVYSFTQKEIEDSTSTTVTTVSVIPVTDEAKEELPKLVEAIRTNQNSYNTTMAYAASSGGSNMVYNKDAARYITAYLTVTYENVTIDGKECVRLKKVDASYTGFGTGSYVGSGISVTDNTVTYGQTGLTAGNNKRFVTQTKTYTAPNNTRSFSITAPTTWTPVIAESEEATVGAYYSVRLTRGSGSWYCTVSNNLTY